MAKRYVKRVVFSRWTTVKRWFASTARPWLHENNAVGTSYAIAVVGRADMYREAVVKNGAAGADRSDVLIFFGK